MQGNICGNMYRKHTFTMMLLNAVGKLNLGIISSVEIPFSHSLDWILNPFPQHNSVAGLTSHIFISSYLSPCQNNSQSPKFLLMTFGNLFPPLNSLSMIWEVLMGTEQMVKLTKENPSSLNYSKEQLILNMCSNMLYQVGVFLLPS